MGRAWLMELCSNAPIEALHLLADPRVDLVCYVIDLYPRDGERPRGLESAFSRKNDLVCGCRNLAGITGLSKGNSSTSDRNARRTTILVIDLGQKRQVQSALSVMRNRP